MGLVLPQPFLQTLWGVLGHKEIEHLYINALLLQRSGDIRQAQRRHGMFIARKRGVDEEDSGLHQTIEHRPGVGPGNQSLFWANHHLRVKLALCGVPTPDAS